MRQRVPLIVLVCATLLSSHPALAQFSQQGPKLVGTGAVEGAYGSYQGTSVSLSADGNTAIVGGPSDNNLAGAAWVWTRTGGGWVQQGTKLTRSGGSTQGDSVSLSADGNTAIVGQGGVNNTGGVWVWTRSGGVWAQQGTKLIGSGGSVNAEQGTSVSLSADGNTAIAGGRLDNSYAGAAWVWTRSGGVWTQQGTKLVGSGAVGTNVYQGISVSLSADGNTAIVGGYGDNSYAGAAWVWTRSGGVWTQQGSKLVGSGAVGFASQGISVSISADGSTAIVGGYGDNSYAGAAWVWTRSGGVWTQQGTKLVGSGAVGTALQGRSVSLSVDGNTAIVGGYGDNTYAGAAWVWTRSGGVWTQQGTKLVGSGAVGNPYVLQGYSVSLSADGSTAIVGGHGDNSYAGAAWVFAASAAQFNYTNNNGTITITGYTGPGGAVIIPSTINGLPVTSIGDWAFYNKSSLTSVTIPNSVTSIGSYVFYLCTSLTSVSIPSSVTVIGLRAFQECSSLTSVTIGNGVDSIGPLVFFGCTSLTSVTIPNTVTSIGSAAFQDCSSLTRVTIPNSVTDIGYTAFASCTSLTGIYFQGNAPSLGSFVFDSDYNATVYYLPDATGWGPTFGGRPTMLWNPQVIPAITAQPQGQTAQAGNNVTFAVTASGTSPLNYQWRFNGQNLTGQTALSLSRTNVQFAAAGGYSVVVTNSFGSATSSAAQLTVYTNLVLTQTNRAPTTNEVGRPTIPTDPTHFRVFTNGTFQSGVALDPNKMTVVITHGWNGSSADWVTVTAQNIAQRIGASTVNIVAWDWTAEATSSIPDLGIIAAKTPGQGTALGTNLVAALGANYSKRIHFIGHSLGTLVNGHAANYVHAHGFSWTNTQMTLCDEAEAAWEFTSTGWQLATTLPKIIISGNFSTPQRYWDHPLPTQFAWADNYISAVGLLHPDAANAILTWDYPTHGSDDFGSWASDWVIFHAFSHNFYEDTIEPGWYQTGGRTNATYMGFICSFEGGGIASRPATNTVFYQNPVGSGYELDLVPTTLSFATNFLNDRLWSVLETATETRDNIGWNFFGDAVGLVFGQINSVGNNVGNMFVNLSTTGGSGSQIQNLKPQPLDGPAPNGGPSPINTPAYAWIPITVPSNAVSMSFDFMLQGNGNQDSFQVALHGTNILSLETSLIQTNVTLNSGLIDISQYARQQVELFLGIVGGTSTNAALTVSNFQFYVRLPPTLEIQLSGTNVVLTWPLSGADYVLQSANQLTPPISWTTVTNVPVIVNFQYTVTNEISGAARLYRLRK